MFDFLGENPMIVGAVIGTVITLIGVIFLLRNKKSPGLDVADKFVKDGIKEDSDAAKTHEDNANNALDNGASGSDISDADAERTNAGAVETGHRK